MQTQNESGHTETPNGPLIGGAFAVLADRPLLGLGGGCPAFAVLDHRGGRNGLIAVQSRLEAPPRAAVLSALGNIPVEGVVSPLAHGPAPGPGGVPAWFVICSAPPGPPVWGEAAAGPAWREAELLNCLLRPAAAALERLHARHVTHRNIRPANLFRATSGAPVTLGCGWAAPPASLQPALFEPPYTATCLPNGRGEGSLADDVYALGVTLLCLAIGRLPMEGLDDDAIVRRKLEVGSFAALVGEERLPSGIADIIRGMLAEDPDHRPPPVLLADPAAARARRVAARPAQRAQVALDMDAGPVWNARVLAHSIATNPEQGARLLRSGVVDRWLRRSLGDSALAARLDEARRQRGGDTAAEEARADALLVTRAAAALDPLAPLCWQGMRLWPDALGPVLAGAGNDEVRCHSLQEMIDAEALAAWAAMRPERGDPLPLRGEAHQLRALMRAKGPGGGLRRLRYALNPLLRCTSPSLEGRMVVRLADLLTSLEAAAANPSQPLPIDAEIAAFMAARHEQRIDGDLALLATGDRAALAQLRLLAALQQRDRIVALPGIAAWLKPQLIPALAVWHSRQRRTVMQGALEDAGKAGNLPGMLAVIEDPTQREIDAREAKVAADGVAAIDAELARLLSQNAARTETARRIGEECALASALCCLAVATMAAVLS